MKTPKKIFDRIFNAGERLARRLGTFQNELYSKAVSRFINESHVLDVTERLDAVYEADPESSRVDPRIARLQIRSLPEEDW